jgi:hypothetical protein
MWRLAEGSLKVGVGVGVGGKWQVVVVEEVWVWLEDTEITFFKQLLAVDF